jgi:hypothetical protein
MFTSRNPPGHGTRIALLLIDSTHRRWFAVTVILAVVALAVYGWLGRGASSGLSGGSIAGLWYGILGSALMIYAGLLSALRKVPAWWWIGSRKTWLKGHIWLGLLSGILILCHSGFHWGGLLERVLWIVFGLTLLTGIFGLFLQQFLPRMITARVPCEGPYEQIPHLCQVMARKADRLMASTWEVDIKGTVMNVAASQMGLGAKVQLQEFYESHVLPFFSGPFRRGALLARPLQAEIAFARLKALPGLAEVKPQIEEMELLCAERRQLADQERLHQLLHGWLLFHVPLSVALLVLGVAHAVVSLYY